MRICLLAALLVFSQPTLCLFAAEPVEPSAWAYTSPRRPVLPVVTQTSRVQNPIDAFVLARLEEKGLTLNKPADKLTLLRRATLDLTGLPPTVAEQDSFLADKSNEAYARVVDRLLSSPRYGERWAQHWLDLVR